MGLTCGIKETSPVRIPEVIWVGIDAGKATIMPQPSMPTAVGEGR
jgi:hypothetical protein